MNKEIVGIFFIPMGIISMCMAALWQMYAVYLLCPNSRKKGIVFFILGGGGAAMYLLARMWLPFSK